MMTTSDYDAAMMAGQAVDARQWAAVRELQRLGWNYSGRDASGRRIIMTRDNMHCRISPDGQAQRRR